MNIIFNLIFFYLLHNNTRRTISNSGESDCSDCDCVSVVIIEFEGLLIIFKTLRNFPGQVSVFALVHSSQRSHILK